MTRPRVLVAQPFFSIVGGGNLVAAWAVQALREEFQVTVATLGEVDCAALNWSFGTSLRDSDFDARIAPPAYSKFQRSLPIQGAQLKIALATRWARALDATEHFDALLSTHNEMDFGRPGVQYVHFPWAHLPRPEIEMRWFHRIPGFLPAYRRFCQMVTGGTLYGSRVNLSLANSSFVAGKLKETYGVDAEILYPPVPGRFPDVPWGQRRPAAVAIGRMHATKRWDMALEIVDAVRSRGVDFGLTLINQPDQADFGRRMAAAAATRPWFRILTGLTREQLSREVSQHRYGIHTMEDEHFGIAVAEMVRGGCIPFVHDSGGPVEIVGGRSELRFGTVEEGADKIAAAAGDSALQERLRAVLAAQRELFDAETFCEFLRRAVRKSCRG